MSRCDASRRPGTFDGDRGGRWRAFDVDGDRAVVVERMTIRLPMTTQMMHAGPWGPRGSLVSVNIEHDDRKSDVKRRVSHATGIPVDELKLCCASPTQLAAASKKCPGLSFGNCGVVERLGLTVVQAESGEKSFVPRLSPNRIDNLGHWTDPK